MPLVDMIVNVNHIIHAENLKNCTPKSYKIIYVKSQSYKTCHLMT